MSYGTYYLVEIQAPSYEDNGTTKYYDLLNKPEQITINESSYTSNPIIVLNRKKTILPMTGRMGTLMFFVAGGILIALGVFFYIKNKKK